MLLLNYLSIVPFASAYSWHAGHVWRSAPQWNSHRMWYDSRYKLRVQSLHSESFYLLMGMTGVAGKVNVILGWLWKVGFQFLLKEFLDFSSERHVIILRKYVLHCKLQSTVINMTFFNVDDVEQVFRKDISYTRFS